MSLQAGTYTLGPGEGTLSVRTGRTGAAAKAGHDLLIDVTAWEATLAVGDDPADTSVELAADAASLRVSKANIEQTIDDDVLKRRAITFRSTAVTGADGRLTVAGELTLAGTTRPLAFDLEIGADGRLRAVAVVKQSDWGMKPYSALFGALKVADDVRVEIDAGLPQSL